MSIERNRASSAPSETAVGLSVSCLVIAVGNNLHGVLRTQLDCRAAAKERRTIATQCAEANNSQQLAQPYDGRPIRDAYRGDGIPNSKFSTYYVGFTSKWRPPRHPANAAQSEPKLSNDVGAPAFAVRTERCRAPGRRRNPGRRPVREHCPQLPECPTLLVRLGTGSLPADAHSARFRTGRGPVLGRPPGPWIHRPSQM